jgi:NodT family efflux transporter outer membrane factor (OMF) lipoprotein
MKMKEWRGAMKRFPLFQGLMVAILLFCLFSCAPYKANESRPPPVSVPEDFSESGHPKAYEDPWWFSFQDPALDALVDQALADNLDLAQAWARLEQATALARRTASGLWPEIAIEVGVRKGQSNFSGGDRLGTFSITTESFPVTIGAAYEVDLWKRIASQKRGAVLDMIATRQDVDAMAMTLAAQVTEAWFGFLEQGTQTRLLVEQQATGRTFLELTRLRFSQGLASALDVYQQRQQLAATRAEVPLVESRKEVFRHQLAVLVGVPPLALVPPEREELPGLPPLPPTGLPVDLLTRRPDVRSAHLRLAAADHRVASAVADRLPALRIGGQTGYESRNLDELELLFDNWIWSIFANITWPIFDGGRRKAEVDRNKAVVKERLGAYGQVVLLALREVEDSLIQERKQAAFVIELERQAKLARDTLREARMRYANGLSDYLPVLAALESLQTVERSQIVAQRQLLSYRVQLYRALGGAWMHALEPPADSSQKTG